MKRTLLLSLGWLVSVAALYAAVLALELYWNLYNWQPIVDGKALAMFVAIVAFLTAIWYLARASRDRVSRGISLVLCLGLIALAIYVLPAEPLTQGLFAREAPSPLWYRAARLLMLAAPGVFWVGNLFAVDRLVAAWHCKARPKC